MKEDAFLFDNYAVTSDGIQFFIHERKIIKKAKKKSSIGKERWRVIGYYSSISSVFYKLSNLICMKHIGNLSIALKKINELTDMIEKLTTLNNGK